MGDDFDPVVFGALLADDAVEPATAMVAALPDRDEPPRSRSSLAAWVFAAAVFVLIVWLLS